MRLLPNPRPADRPTLLLLAIVALLLVGVLVSKLWIAPAPFVMPLAKLWGL